MCVSVFLLSRSLIAVVHAALRSPCILALVSPTLHHVIIVESASTSTNIININNNNCADNIASLIGSLPFSSSPLLSCSSGSRVNYKRPELPPGHHCFHLVIVVVVVVVVIPMKPTLPAYRFRVRSRTDATASSSAPPSQSRTIFVLPFSLIAILVILAIAAPPALPRSRWLPLTSLSSSSSSSSSNTSMSSPSSVSDASNPESNHLLASRADSSENHSSSPSDTTTTTTSISAVDSTIASSSSSTDARSETPDTKPPSVAQSDASLPTRPLGRRLQATAPSNALHLPLPPPAAPASEAGGPPEANLAYFIQVSDNTVAHLPRLLARIYHPRNVYAIHFDKKVDIKLTSRVKENMVKRNPSYKDNVMYMRPELITYRGVSMLLNTINAMRELLDFSADWHYFINLSGADYPLVSQKTVRQSLGKHIEKPLNFLTYAPEEKWEPNIGYRVDNIYVDEALSFQSEGGEVQQLDAYNPLARSMRLRYTNAEAWMMNSRQLCHFVIHSAYARKMLLTFAYSVEASEHYFATLIWNHRLFNRTIVNHAMREVVWEHEGQEAGQHPFFIDQKKSDGSFMFRYRMLTAPTFFIRKFKKADSPLMDILDGRWQNETHLKAVREKFDWHVLISMEEHAQKPPLPESIVIRR